MTEAEMGEWQPQAQGLWEPGGAGGALPWRRWAEQGSQNREAGRFLGAAPANGYGFAHSPSQASSFPLDGLTGNPRPVARPVQQGCPESDHLSGRS